MSIPRGVLSAGVAIRACESILLQNMSSTGCRELGFKVCLCFRNVALLPAFVAKVVEQYTIV